jgi:hypothetical protein
MLAIVVMLEQSAYRCCRKLSFQRGEPISDFPEELSESIIEKLIETSGNSFDFPKSPAESKKKEHED